MAEDFLTEDEVRVLYQAGDAAHDFDHVRRVIALAVHIAEAEGADVTVVRLAALLHDLPAAEHRGDEPAAARDAHHLAAAQAARSLLLARGLGTERTGSVVHCIEAHRFRDRTVQPQTLEAKCLYDADKLDSIGATGVARAFAFAGAHGHRLWTQPWTQAPPDAAKPAGADYTPVHEFVYKLRRIAGALHTDTARALGRQRHATMVQYFAALDVEMEGLA